MNAAEKLKSLSIDRDSPARGAGAPRRRGSGGVAVIAVSASALALAAVAFVVLGPSGGPVRTAPTAAPSTGAAASAAPSPQIEALSSPRGGLVASGYVVARRSATVSTDITGRLAEVSFEEGAEVAQGQVLARLDSTLAAYDLKLAQSALETAQANLGVLTANIAEADARLARDRKLYPGGAVSQSELEAATAQAGSLRAQREAAQSGAEAARLSVQRQSEFLAHHEIRAPFAGRIIAKNAQAGEILSPSAGGGQFTRTGVATLVDMTSLEVEVDVNEGQIADIEAGQTATVILDAYPGKSIPAEVIAIVPTANRDRATIRVRVGFKDHDPHILPEMAAKVTFDRSKR